MMDEDRQSGLEKMGHLNVSALGLSETHQHEFAMKIKHLHDRFPNAPTGYIELAAATDQLQVLAWRTHDTIRHDTRIGQAIEHKIREASAELGDGDVATVLYQSLPWREMDDLAKETEKLVSTYQDEGSDQPLPVGVSRVQQIRKTANTSFAEAIGKNDARLTTLATILQKYGRMAETFNEQYGSDLYPDNREELQDAATLAHHYSDIAKNLEPESPDTWKRF